MKSIKKYVLRQMIMKTHWPKSKEHSQSSSKRQIHINRLPQGIRKISYKQSNSILIGTMGEKSPKGAERRK